MTAYSAQQRKHEVAIRIAIGATGTDVTRTFLKDSSPVLSLGIGSGLIGATAVAKLLENQLFGVHSLDLLTFAAATGFMAVVGLLATWWPARRRASTSPLGALNEI